MAKTTQETPTEQSVQKFCVKPQGAHNLAG